MPIDNLIVLGAVVAAFATFIVVLGGVAWWSNQTPKPARARTSIQSARVPMPASLSVAARR